MCFLQLFTKGFSAHYPDSAPNIIRGQGGSYPQDLAGSRGGCSKQIYKSLFTKLQLRVTQCALKRGSRSNFLVRLVPEETVTLYILGAFSVRKGKPYKLKTPFLHDLFTSDAGDISYLPLLVSALFCFILKIFNLLCAFRCKSHWMLLESGIVWLLRKHELGCKIWHMALLWGDNGSEKKLLFNFFPLLSDYTASLYARKLLSVQEEPEEALAGLHSQ